MSGYELRLVLVGWGAIGQRVADLLARRGAPVKIVGVGLRDVASPRKGLPDGARIFADPETLDNISADLVLEAAGRDAVGPWARAALSCGVDIAISSTSALTDAALLNELIALARSNRAQIVIPPGALGGIDALAAASRLPLATVRHEIVKPAHAWSGTPAAALTDLDSLSAPFTFFEGTARQAADTYPQNANVAVIAAFAGIGLDRTIVALTADPHAARNSHRITATGAFGTMTLSLENRPLETNPKSSEMTALSLVRLIENRACPLVI